MHELDQDVEKIILISKLVKAFMDVSSAEWLTQLYCCPQQRKAFKQLSSDSHTTEGDLKYYLKGLKIDMI